MKRILWAFLAVVLPVAAHAGLRPPASGGVVLGTTLQAGATFFVSSGTIVNLNASTATLTNLIGTITNDSAAAGNVGEYISSTTLIVGIVSGGNGVLGDVASILLTPGDWDISGSATALLNGATVTAWDVYILPVAGNSSTGFNVSNSDSGLPPTAATNMTLTIPRIRASLTANTTYYLKTDFALGAGNCKSAGTINARRVR